MLKTVRLAALGAAMALSVPAAAQTYNATEVKRSITTADLAAIVVSLGHEVVENRPADQIVIARDKNGESYFLIGTACDTGGVAGCQGIMMQVRYGMPPNVTLDSLARANFENAAVNVWADFQNDTLGITRYQVLDHGATMANIRANIEVLLGLAPGAVAMANGDR